MKFAVLSDIHGNLPALEAVIDHVEAWRPDVVVVDGDIVSRGPLSHRCLELLLTKRRDAGWVLLKGNHEDLVVECSAEPDDGPEYELKRFAHYACRQLNGRVSDIRTMSDCYQWTALTGDCLRVVHASMRSNRDGIYPETNDEELRQKIAPRPAVFVTGHTHRPLIRPVDGCTVVNVGSVGSPFDEDRRASYGRFVRGRGDWQVEIVRLPYNYAQVERDYVESGFLEEGGPLAQLMLVELRKARGLIFRWAGRYETAIRAGDISLAESVRRILQDEDVRPFVGSPGWTE